MRPISAWLLAACAALAEPGATGGPDAPPNPADLLELLGSEDPALRDVGRRALETLPPEKAGEIEDLAGRATDPEVQATLAAAAARLRRRPLLEKAEAMAKEVVARPRRAWWRLLEEGSAAPQVLMLWLLRDDNMENPLRDPDSLWGDRPVELGACAAAWLGLITGEDLGRDPEAWGAFFDARRELSLEDLAVQALEKRGYRVSHADAGVAAGDLIRAISEEPDRQRQAADRGRRYRSLAPTAEWIAQSRILGRTPTRFLVPKLPPAEEAADWVAAHRGHIVWREGRFASTAGPDHFLGLLDGSDDAARRGALRALVAFPLEAAPAIRPWLQREPVLVAAILAAAKSPAAPEELPRVLSALEYELDAPEYAGLWDPDVLAAFVASTADDGLRAKAILALAGCGARRHTATALNYLQLEGAEVATAAALALAELGDDAVARRAIPWIERKPGPVMRSVAVALALRGVPEGFEAARAAAGRGDLLARDLGRLARCVEEAPDPRDEVVWQAWAAGGDRAWEWNAETQKWRIQGRK